MDSSFGVVESDARFGRDLIGFLDQHGMSAELHGDARSLLPSLARRPPRMVLLGLQEGRAMQSLQRIRDISRVPCVVLGGADELAGQADLLEAGADDLIDRTLPLPLLLARIRAVLRRADWGSAMATPTDWRLLPQRRQLLRPSGAECTLTTAEFDLFALLALAHGATVSRDDVSEKVFRRRYMAGDRSVDNLVVRLRRKLGPDQDDAIRTVRSIGYMFSGFAGGELEIVAAAPVTQ